MDAMDVALPPERANGPCQVSQQRFSRRRSRERRRTPTGRSTSHTALPRSAAQPLFRSRRPSAMPFRLRLSAPGRRTRRSRGASHRRASSVRCCRHRRDRVVTVAGGWQRGGWHGVLPGHRLHPTHRWAISWLDHGPRKMGMPSPRRHRARQGMRAHKAFGRSPWGFLLPSYPGGFVLLLSASRFDRVHADGSHPATPCRRCYDDSLAERRRSTGSVLLKSPSRI